MAKGFDFIGMVIAAPADKQAEMLKQAAEMFQQPVAELEAELQKRVAATRLSREKAERKRQREERNALIEKQTSFVESLRGDNEALCDAFEAVSELGGFIVLSGFSEGNPTFTVAGLKPAKAGGTGGGKPASDSPRPFTDSNGGRVYGQITVWAEENLGIDALEMLAEEHSIELNFSPKTGKLASKNLVKLLKKAGELIDSPL